MPLQVDFDPSCADAAALRKKHAGQRAFLMNDVAGPSRLRDIVLQRQENDLIDHKVGCARCGPYRPPCGACGRAATAGHKFFCPHNAHRWRKLFGLRVPESGVAKPQLPPRPRTPTVTVRRGPDAPIATDGGRVARPLAGKTSASPKRAEPKPSPVPAPAPPRAPPQAPAAPPRPQPRPAQAPPAAPKKPAPPPYDPLVVLGLEPGVAWEDIKSAYRQKAQQYHPDKVATLAPEFREIAEKRMREINRAYETLEKKQKASA